MSDVDPVLIGVLAVALVGVTVLAAAITRRPWLLPWLAVPIFACSAELQLRIVPSFGVVKDVVVVFVVVLAFVRAHREHTLVERLRPWRAPLGALAVLLGLYVANPLGGHGLDWLLSVRLLLEALGLFVAALLLPQGRLAVVHLVRAVAATAAFEAVFAWVQQFAGEQSLVHTWGYQFGAQVRLTSTGGLRTSGTFSDPFQLAALGTLALCLALFVAHRRLAAVLIVSALAIEAATSVRTMLVQIVVLVLLWALSRGWRVRAAVVSLATTAAGLYVGATTTTSLYPGAPPTPLLAGLNGRSTAWQLAVQGPLSLLGGNGVAAVGSGSTRAAQGLLSSVPTYNTAASPIAVFAGNTGFLDSAYAQIQSDVGVLGIVALVLWLLGTVRVLWRRRGSVGGSPVASRAPRWAALALLGVSAIDWVGRTTLVSFPTGFLILFAFGLLAQATLPAVTQRARVNWGRTPVQLRRPAVAPAPVNLLDLDVPFTAVTSTVAEVAVTSTVAPARSSARLARVGVLAAVASRTFGRLVGLLFVVVLARTSSDDTVAVYGYLLGTATLVITLTDLGVAAISGREVAAGRLPARAALAAALPAQVVSIAAACAVTLGLIAVSAPSMLTAGPVLMTLAFLLLNGMVNLWGELLRGQGRVLLEGGLQMLSALLLVGGGSAVVVAGGGATALLAVVAGKEIIVLLLSVAMLRPKWEPEVVRTRSLLRHSLQLALAGTAVIVIWRQGTLFVGATGSVGALAVYVVGSRFLDAGVTLANTVGFGMLPGAAATAADPVAFRAMASRYVAVVTTVGAVIAAAGLVFARPVTLGLFGARWVDAVPVVRVIAVAMLPIFLGYVVWFLLLAAGQQRWLAGAATAGALVSVAASLLWSLTVTAPIAAGEGTAAGAMVLAGILFGRLIAVLRPAHAGDSPTDSAPCDPACEESSRSDVATLESLVTSESADVMPRELVAAGRDSATAEY